MAQKLDFELWLAEWFDMSQEDYSKEDKRTRSEIKKKYQEYLQEEEADD